MDTWTCVLPTWISCEHWFCHMMSNCVLFKLGPIEQNIVGLWQGQMKNEVDCVDEHPEWEHCSRNQHHKRKINTNAKALSQDNLLSFQLSLLFHPAVVQLHQLWPWHLSQFLHQICVEHVWNDDLYWHATLTACFIYHFGFNKHSGSQTIRQTWCFPSDSSWLLKVNGSLNSLAV